MTNHLTFNEVHQMLRTAIIKAGSVEDFCAATGCSQTRLAHMLVSGVVVDEVLVVLKLKRIECYEPEEE